MSRRPSPTTIIACLALFFSLAGTGIAASHYIITSTSQIKPSVRRALRGAEGARGPAGAAASEANLQGLESRVTQFGAEITHRAEANLDRLEGRTRELEADLTHLCISGIGEALAGAPPIGSTEALHEALSTIDRNCNY
jgi:hypothetical protein